MIGKTPGHQPASLEVHGQIASILAAMAASTILEQRMKLLRAHDFEMRAAAGELDTEVKRKKLLDAYAEELDVRRGEWSNLQVSVVAGAWWLGDLQSLWRLGCGGNIFPIAAPPIEFDANRYPQLSPNAHPWGRLTIVDAGGATPCRPSGDTGHADRRQRSADYGSGRRDEAGEQYAWRVARHITDAKCGRHSEPNYSRALIDVHFPSPRTRFPGNSLRFCLRSFTSIFSAFVGFLKEKSSSMTASPDFQSLI